MKKYLFLFLLSSCGTTVDLNSFFQQNYGKECNSRPYIEHRDDHTLCLIQALSKEWSQNKLTNNYIEKK